MWYSIYLQSHLSRCSVDIVQLKWSRINVKGKAHKHSFVRDGDEKRTVSAVVDATKGKNAVTATCQGGISGLLCLKVSLLSPRRSRTSEAASDRGRRRVPAAARRIVSRSVRDN